MKRAVWLVLVLAVIAAAVYALAITFGKRDDATSTYRTAAVKRADVVSAITATGTIVPEDVVDVGAQINGQIASFGNDLDGKPVDFRSTVAQGAVLARIDDALFAADVASGEAQVAQATAQVHLGEANLALAKARLDQTQRDWDRAQKLAESPAFAKTDFDAARSNFEQAKASVGVAEATIAQAQASVSNAQASLLRSKRNLTYCTILSPVDGVILDRRVEIGQTVVASLNAPSLFLIAKDLRKMKLLVQVNEADIAHIEVGHEITFTADAISGRVFTGSVRKVRLNATMTQNVVTYTVEIGADNPDLVLLPYLTANVTFEVARREKVLVVPNAALRWSPRDALADSPTSSGGGGGRGARGANRGPRIWIVENDQPRALRVTAGLSDGSVTEVSGEGVAEDLQVIIGDLVTGARAAPGASPFTPQLPTGGRGR